MKSPSVDSLVPNEIVTAQFLVISKEVRQKKTGEPYLSLHLADRTGELEAKMWDNVSEVMDTFDRDHFVKVKGLAQLYNNRSQFVIHRLRRLEDNEVEFSDYFPCAERSPEDMFSELQGIIASIGNTHLRSLLELIFSDAELTALYKIAPAAKTIHHACRSGLLEHVLSLCTLARLTAAHYPEVDIDLLLAGVILHDIGKVQELTYARSFGYSAEGQLLGHIILGLRLAGAKIDQIASFPAKLRTLVEHLIISHHGELEFGSPKIPLFPEAMLLHHLDNLDSKMNAMRTVLKRDVHSTAEFTPWVASLERALLRKDRYLSAESPETGSSAVDIAPKAEMEDVAPVQQATEHQTTDPPPPAASTSPFPGIPSAETRVPGPSPQAPTPVRKANPSQPQTNTLFGEKLQAVLSGRK